MLFEMMIYTDEQDRMRQIRKREAVKLVAREKSSPERRAEIRRDNMLLRELGVVDPAGDRYAA